MVPSFEKPFSLIFIYWIIFIIIKKSLRVKLEIYKVGNFLGKIIIIINLLYVFLNYIFHEVLIDFHASTFLPSALTTDKYVKYDVFLN